MSRLSFPVLVALALLTNIASAQQSRRATRVGPEAVASPRSPRVVEVQASEPVRAEISDTPSTAPTALPPSRGQQLAEAKAFVAQAQLDRLGGFNQYAQPGATGYQVADVLPPAGGIAPARTGAPVRLFQPGSTFSHVLQKAGENRHLAELKVAAEAAKTEATRLAEAKQQQLRTPNEVARDLELNAAKLQSAQQRMEQLQRLSAATYSQLYQNLGDKLQLEIYEAGLQQQALVEEAAQLSEQPK